MKIQKSYKGSLTGAFIIGIMCFAVLFPVMLLMTSMWASARPIFAQQIANSPVMNSLQITQATNQINRLGDSFFYYSSDSIIVILYFAMIAALFISALYENSRPETLPIGLLFLIPLIIITLPLSDLYHSFYTNSGFANVAGYYPSTEYLADYSPLLTSLITVIYLVFLITRKNILQVGGGAGGGVNVVSG